MPEGKGGDQWWWKAAAVLGRVASYEKVVELYMEKKTIKCLVETAMKHNPLSLSPLKQLSNIWNTRKQDQSATNIVVRESSYF